LEPAAQIISSYKKQPYLLMNSCNQTTRAL